MENHLTLTILADNQASPGLLSEHGFSLWIEFNDQRILFDTGVGTSIEKNAEKLGIPLRDDKIVVLSHGHYDHTGGLAKIIAISAKQPDIYCHPGILRERYSIWNGQPKSISLPRESMEAFNQLTNTKIHWITKTQTLFPGFELSGEIIRTNTFEDCGGPLFFDSCGQQIDLIEDDLAAYLETDKGIIICVGCCHAGISNTIKHLRNQGVTQTIRGIIGGLHLLNADENRLKSIFNFLQTLDLEFIIPCHCTGDQVVEKLRARFKDKVTSGYAGLTVNLG